MKKLILLFVFASILTSCNVDDNGPIIQRTYAKVTATNLPAYFEKDKTYDIKFTYVLPNSCHTAVGVYAERGSASGDKKRDIYVWGVASYDATLTECTLPDSNLEKESTLKLLIDEDEDYTFYLWTGVDSTGQSTFTKVVVPVGAPDDDEDEETPAA